MFESISLEEFEGRTGITPQFTVRATKVVSLRDLTPDRVISVQAMPVDYLEKLLRSVTLVGDQTCRPYRNCEIRLARVDSSVLVVGQTFVQWSKCQQILVSLRHILNGLCVPGLAKRNALIIFGRTIEGEEAVAHYVPPVIEVSSSHQFLLDGIHRNFLVMGVGTTIESILVRGVTTPLPCTAKEWPTIAMVEHKPPPDQRFHNLQPHLFRNLKWIGVDG